jgi:hypothetical protein
MQGLSLEARTHDLLGIPLMINVKFAWSLLPHHSLWCLVPKFYLLPGPLFSHKIELATCT